MAGLGALAVFAAGWTALVLAAPAGADPVNPSDQQINQAQAEADANAAELGRLNGVVAAIDAQVARDQQQAQDALDRYDKATQDVAAAIAAVDAAQAALDAAKQAEQLERQHGRELAVESYMSSTPFTSSALLLAKDPSQAVETLDTRRYLSARQIEQVAAVTVAVVGSSNAEASLRAAQKVAEDLQIEADRLKDEALATLRNTQAQKVTLDAQRAAANDQAAQAAGKLAGLKDQRAAYDAWAAEQARLAELERQRQAAIAAAQAAERQRAAEEAQRQRASAGAPSAPAASSGGGSAAPSTPTYTVGGDGAEWVKPLAPGSYYVSSCYCARWGTFHDGVDLAAAYGTPIYAIGAGTVVAAGPASGYGNWVVINHGNGYYSVYGHMKVLAVSVGQSVGPGQLIAYVASEGQSTGPHLHLTIKRGGINGPSLDPEVYLATRGVYL